MISEICFFPFAGKPFALIVFMILVIIRMKVIPGKYKELSQTIASLIISIRTEKGCEHCDFCRSMEDENELILLEEWNTRENLKGHLESDRFRVLRGTLNLLQKPSEMMCCTVDRPDKTGITEPYPCRR